jgi:hypothetical protein
MKKTQSAAKTPQEIRACTEKLISQHRASVQGWLSAHYPGVSTNVDQKLASTLSDGFSGLNAKSRAIK